MSDVSDLQRYEKVLDNIVERTKDYLREKPFFLTVSGSFMRKRVVYPDSDIDGIMVIQGELPKKDNDYLTAVISASCNEEGIARDVLFYPYSETYLKEQIEEPNFLGHIYPIVFSRILSGELYFSNFDHDSVIQGFKNRIEEVHGQEAKDLMRRYSENARR